MTQTYLRRDSLVVEEEEEYVSLAIAVETAYVT